MPSFDITSEADMVALKNAVDIAGRHIGNRYDFKGTSARAELNEKDKTIMIYGDYDVDGSHHCACGYVLEVRVLDV